MQAVDRFVATRYGRIHYREQGEGEPLLLLHSNGFSVHEYERVLPLLAQHYRCIAWDLPGHGDSDPGQGHQSVADYAAITVGLMDALHIPRAHVCGASIGGLVCIALGALAPARVLSLVIVEAALRSAHEWAAQWPRIEASFGIPQQSLEQIAPRFRAADEALLQRWNLDRHKAGGWRMVDVMWAIRQYDAFTDMARLRVPAVVVVGDAGPAIAGRPHVERLMPQAPVKVLADAGHFPMIDDPAAFAEAVHGGITEVAQSTGQA